MSSVEPLSIAPKEAPDESLQKNPLLPLLEKQRKAFLERGIMTAEQRVELLERLSKATCEYAEQLVKAVRRQCHHHRIVPGADNPDHALGLIDNLAGRRQGHQARRRVLGLHPFLDLALDHAYLAGHPR